MWFEMNVRLIQSISSIALNRRRVVLDAVTSGRTVCGGSVLVECGRSTSTDCISTSWQTLSPLCVWWRLCSVEHSTDQHHNQPPTARQARCLRRYDNLYSQVKYIR